METLVPLVPLVIGVGQAGQAPWTNHDSLLLVSEQRNPIVFLDTESICLGVFQIFSHT